MPDRNADDRGGDWETRRRARLTAGLEATPQQRVAWLVAAIELAWRTGALPKPRDAWGRIVRGSGRSGS